MQDRTRCLPHVFFFADTGVNKHLLFARMRDSEFLRSFVDPTAFRALGCLHGSRLSVC